MGMSERPMDADERLTVGIYVEIFVIEVPCQDITGGFRGIPAG